MPFFKQELRNWSELKKKKMELNIKKSFRDTKGQRSTFLQEKDPKNTPVVQGEAGKNILYIFIELCLNEKIQPCKNYL